MTHRLSSLLTHWPYSYILRQRSDVGGSLTSLLFACRLPCPVPELEMAMRAVRKRAIRPPNPLSARSIKKAKVLANKLHKCAKDQTAANCTWSTNDRGGLRTMNVEMCCSTVMSCDTITPVQEGGRLADLFIY